MAKRKESESNEDMFRRYLAGGRTDKSVLDAILMRNKGLVYGIARKYARCEDEVDELAQEGYIGFMLSLRPGYYDPDKSKITTYASYAIRNRISKYLKKRIKENSRMPSVSLDAERTAGDSDYSYSLLSSLFDSDDPALCVESNEEFETMRKKAVRRVELLLNERQRHILLARCNGETFKSIGDRLGVSKERIRQVEGIAIRLLQEPDHAIGKHRGDSQAD